jgi:hypothetical protein
MSGLRLPISLDREVPQFQALWFRSEGSQVLRVRGERHLVGATVAHDDWREYHRDGDYATRRPYRLGCSFRGSGSLLGESRFYGVPSCCVGLFSLAIRIGRGSEQAPAGNSAMTSLFHAGCQWRGVADVRRYAMPWPAIKVAYLAVLCFLCRELQAQGQYQDFLYYTNDGTITISGYTGQTDSLVIPSSINGLPVTIIGSWAFASNGGLFIASIPASVGSIGDGAFPEQLFEVYFGGNCPRVGIQGLPLGLGSKVFHSPGTTGWGDPYANGMSLSGAQLVLWDPVIQTADGSFGIQPGGFGFNISGTPDIPVAAEVCTNLSAPVWVQSQIFALTNGLVRFSDPEWTNFPSRFYRVQWPATRVWSLGRPWP